MARRIRIPAFRFSQQAGDVVMYLRDTVPPGLGENSGDIRDWQNDSKNSGTHLNYDPAGTHTLNVPPVRPGHTYYLGFRAVNDAMFSVSFATSGGTFAGTNDLAFYGGYVTNLLPAYGSALYRIVVPEDAVRWRSHATNADGVFLACSSTSSDLATWSTLTNITVTATPFEVLDASALGQTQRFYRLVSP
jgi:hypothetical protein